jgi:hypothetical protein
MEKQLNTDPICHEAVLAKTQKQSAFSTDKQLLQTRVNKFDRNKELLLLHKPNKLYLRSASSLGTKKKKQVIKLKYILSM